MVCFGGCYGPHRSCSWSVAVVVVCLGGCYGPRRSCSWSVAVVVGVVGGANADVVVVVVAAAVAAFVADVYDGDDVLFRLLFLGDDVFAALRRSLSSLSSRLLCCR